MQKIMTKKHAWLSIILAVSMVLSILPYSLVQAAGNSSNNTPYDFISTVAGTGVLGYSGDGGPATSATLNSPGGTAVDNSGNLYIADNSNHRVRKVDAATGTISTIAGTTVNGAVYSGYSGDGGPATTAALKGPTDVAVYSSVTGSVYLYITDYQNFRVRKVDTSTGIITTVAGNGTYGYSGDGGPATSATFKSANAIAVDSSGNLYITDDRRIRKVDAGTGVISTVAGTGNIGYLGDGGLATSANISPFDVAVDSAGNLYITDSSNRIREVAATNHTQYGISMTAGNIYTIAGTGTRGYSGDGGAATSANIGQLQSLSLDSAGNLYFADGTYRVRRIDTSGIITTVAGNGNYASSGDGGLATNASLYIPRGLATDSTGNVYLSEYGGRIRKVYLPLSTPALKTVTISNSPNLNYGGAPLTYDLSNLTIAGADQFGAAFDISGYTPVWSVKAGPATVSGSTLTITGSGSVSVAATVNGLATNTLYLTATQNPPVLNANVADNVADRDITLTFTDDSHWRGAITGITVDGAALTATQYTVSTGTITFPAGVLATIGNHNIVVKATGYADATVTQSIIGFITAGSIEGTKTVTEWDVNADGVTITIGLDQGYSFADDVSAYKDAIIDGLSFHGLLFDKTGSVTGNALTYYPVPYNTFLTKALNLYSGSGGYFPYIDTVYDVTSQTYSSPNKITTYDRFVGLDPKGAQSIATVTDELKIQYPGVKKGIINALKAGATVSVNSEGKLVIRATKDAANGYFSKFTNGVPVVGGGVQIANCDILMSADLPPGVVKNVNEVVRTSGYYTIQEMKIHPEVWEYVDESRKDEAGVFKFDTRINGLDRNTSSSYPYDKTYYVKKVEGNVLTEADIRNGGTMGPNGTGNKLIKLVIDDRVGPTQWASSKNMGTFFTNLFRTSKDATGYSGYSSTTYTPADDPIWLKVEDQITNGGTDQALPYNVQTNKYVINYSGDNRGDVINPASMWMFYELPKTPDFDISSDMTVYLNMIAGFYGGSGQSTPQNGQPVLGMDGRYSFTIKTVNPAIGVELDQDTITLTAGANRTLTATVAPADATNKNVTWTTSDSTVATVTYGVVTAVGAGTATITVTTEDGSFTDICQVTVNPATVAVTGVGLDQDTITLAPGATGTLTATVAPAEATNKNVTWTTSNSTVATVTNGVVTAVGAGTATVTVTTEDGSFTDTCAVTVNPAAVAVTGVGLDQHAITLTPGATGTLTATVAPADATNKNVIWSTSDSNVATVTNGVVTAVGTGTATITVTTQEGGFTDTCQVTVNSRRGGRGGGGGGIPPTTTQTPTITTQTPATDLGQVTRSGNTATLQVDAQKAADLLKDAAQSELVINLSQVTAESGQSKAVQLPAEVIDLAKTGSKPIVIQDSGLSIVIPHEVLTQGQNMTFSTTKVSSQTVASAPEHVENKAVYSFDASAGETALHNFTKSITITLPVPAGVTEPDKLGVYYLNETTGQWDYMGGRIVDGKLVFNTNHFSKYMVAESRKTFGDLVSHWAKADIEVMVARHVINGMDADSFAPQNNITRAEFAALLSRVLKLSDATGEGTFKDITGSEWYANDVLKAAKAGIIQGSDGNFRPGDYITRQEMAVMINRAYSYAGGKIETLKALTFTDKGSISAWANDAVQSVYTLGIINGYPDGSFGALDHATRAEGTVMLKTFMDKLGL